MRGNTTCHHNHGQSPMTLPRANRTVSPPNSHIPVVSIGFSLRGLDALIQPPIPRRVAQQCRASRCLAMRVAEQPTEALSTSHLSAVARKCWLRCDAVVGRGLDDCAPYDSGPGTAGSHNTGSVHPA